MVKTDRKPHIWSEIEHYNLTALQNNIKNAWGAVKEMARKYILVKLS